MDKTAWRWFPLGLIAAMACVFVINGWMVYLAVQGFPGAAGTDGFDLSNDYKKVLAAEARQAALGWQVKLDVDGTRHPVLRLTDRTGAPLPAAVIEARAERPVGPADVTRLPFHPVGQGSYRAETTLFSGQWDILLTVRDGAQVYSTTQRVMTH